MSAHVLLNFSNTEKGDKMQGFAKILSLFCNKFNKTGAQMLDSTHHTVSHFNYAPPFQGPHFLTKMLESNILYDHLRFDILSV